VLELPGRLDADKFLARHWQKEHLFMPQAVDRLRPSVTRNELAWLATQEDVESRIVFSERTGPQVRYRAESGPFDGDFLAGLPRRDWTLLVHDVEKHLPVMRRLFDLVPFVPDWRIDDLMISFAAPGGGVGPHRDNYDVFLCQGIGVREWRITNEPVEDDPGASEDLALTCEFGDGDPYLAREGDILYLPPGMVHWGTARRACLTYSIGMRAPQLSDLSEGLPDVEDHNAFYADPDLRPNEARPGFISPQSTMRALRLLGKTADESEAVAIALGRSATATKNWLAPEPPGDVEIEGMLQLLRSGATLPVHGMARVAFDNTHAYVNGQAVARPPASSEILAMICRSRRMKVPHEPGKIAAGFLKKLLAAGLCEIPGNL
jgi:50S ribosomal protein L16 3-hydroxylase